MKLLGIITVLLLGGVAAAADLPKVVPVGASVLLPIEGAQNVQWPTNEAEYATASSDPEIVKVVRVTTDGGMKMIVAVGKKVGIATITCEFQTPSEPPTTKTSVFQVWVTQDEGRANTILADYNRPNAVMTAHRIGTGERLRIEGTAASHYDLKAAMLALPNRDLAVDSIEWRVAVLGTCPCPNARTVVRCPPRRR